MKFELINTAGRLQAVRAANEHMDEKRAEILSGQELKPDAAQLKSGGILAASMLGSEVKLDEMIAMLDIHADSMQIDICAGERDDEQIAAFTKKIVPNGGACVRFCKSGRLPKNVYRIDIYALIENHPHITITGEKDDV